MYPTLLFFSGGLIALMLTLNGHLSQAAGLAPALMLIHATGLLASLPLLRRDPPGKGAKASWLLYMAGPLGVGLTLADLYCVTSMGVTMTTAIKLLGQLWGSFGLDLTGVPGMPRSKPSPSAPVGRLLTLGLATLGCLMMTDFRPTTDPTILLALFSGVFQALAAALNASLGARIGNFKSVACNFGAGLLTCLPVLLLSFGIPGLGLSAGRSARAVLPALASVPLAVLIGGGLCAVLVVGSRTLCFGHVPMLTATLLLLLGQLGFGSVLDIWMGHAPDSQLLAGAAVMLLGLTIGNIGRRAFLYAVSPSLAQAGGKGEKSGLSGGKKGKIRHA